MAEIKGLQKHNSKIEAVKNMEIIGAKLLVNVWIGGRNCGRERAKLLSASMMVNLG